MTENGMSAWQRDGSANSANETRIGYVIALLRGILGIVDGPLLMIVMVETNERLAARESLKK